MKILLLDNNIMENSWGAHDLKRLIQSAEPNATIYVRRGPHNDFPKNIDAYDKIILSGSITSATEEAQWIENLESLIKETVHKQKPILGVCYGHQMIARVLGGKTTVRKAQTPELGWTEINVTHKDTFLLKGLPETFHSYSSHFDEVHIIPEGFVASARSDICAIQAIESTSKPIFGIQFHPEKTIEEADQSYKENKKKRLDKFHLNPHKGKKLYKEEVGKTVFKNFLKL